MIDYYGIPEDTPGAADQPAGSPLSRVMHVERSMAAAIGSSRFRPHLTLHETEAWIFAAGDVLARRFGDPGLDRQVAAIVAASGGPEQVDDGSETAPSKRLANMCPTYAKVVDGAAILAEAGLPVILDQCPHARTWIESLLP